MHREVLVFVPVPRSGAVAHLVGDSCIIVSTVPRFEKRHVVPGLHLYRPLVIILLRRTRNETKRCVEPLDLKRLHLDAAILDGPKLCKSLLKSAARPRLVQLSSRAQIVNARFEETTALIKKKQGHKLSTGLAAARRHEWSRKEKLAAVWQTADVTGVVVVMLYRDEFRLAHGRVFFGAFSNFSTARVFRSTLNARPSSIITMSFPSRILIWLM